MAGPRKPKGPMEKPKNAGKTIKRLFSYFAHYKLLLLLVLICIIITSGTMIFATAMMQPTLDRYIIPFIGQKDADMTGFLPLLAGMVCVFVLSAFAQWANSRIMLHISTKTLYRIRTELFEHMQKLSIKYFDTHTHGELMSRYTNDTDTLRDMMSQVLPRLFSSILTVVASLVMMISLSPLLTVLVFVCIFAMVAITGFVGKKSATAFRAQQESLGAVNGFIEEMIEGQKVVKVFCREEQVKKDFANLNNKLCDAGTRANTFGNIMGPIMNNMGHISYALNAIAGVLLIIVGKMTIGGIAAFLQHSKNFTQPVTEMAQLCTSVFNALAGAERVFAVIDAEPEVDDGLITLEKIDGELVWKNPNGEKIGAKGLVQFDGVTFGYRSEKTILHDISLVAKPGQKIALVGSTGSGKTTITNLINRFYDVTPSNGRISFDGLDITSIQKSSVRSFLAMVLQDTHLFTGTIADNIRFGKLDATMDEVVDAAKLANADYFIRHLHDGYNTVITGDGANLSQGQRQLLAIARAAIANPAVLILDEATSSIDTRTEALIEKAMDRLMRGRTVFVIAHRLSTVRNADCILVLEDGVIIEQGNHDELIAKQGKYYQLYTGASA